MNWDELTAQDFTAAVEDSKGVCVLPLGVMEKHGGHLPLGTDLFIVRAVCEMAAQAEPAVVFPHYFFTQIAEARHAPGTVAIPPRLMWDLLEATCVEIHRNGFKKILIVNGHGGNNAFLPHFAIASLDQQREYTMYFAPFLKDYAEVVPEVFGTPLDGHAGKSETSKMLALRPELVKTEHYNQNVAPLKRLAHLCGIHTPMFWYADYPEHMAGDPRQATAAKGHEILKKLSERMVATLRAVKADETAPALRREFYERCL